jgi:hypothetical protein
MDDKLLKVIQDNLELFINGNSYYELSKEIHSSFLNIGFALDTFALAEYYQKNFKIISSEKLETIFNAYTSCYYSAKDYESNIQNKQSRPYWLYEDLSDNCNSKPCLNLVGKVFHCDNPIWDKFLPPNHLNCSGYIKPLTTNEVEENKLNVTNDFNINHPFPEWAFNSSKKNLKEFFSYLVAVYL